jgi:hypothetical protein
MNSLLLCWSLIVAPGEDESVNLSSPSLGVQHARHPERGEGPDDDRYFARG